MNRNQIVSLIMGSGLLLSSLAQAYTPTASMHANWVFSGIVSNESGEHYGYFFQMQRDVDKFHVVTALVDSQTKKVLFQDDSYAVIASPNELNWKVGYSFLRYNPINDSWVFGIKNKEKKGFNFKVDMLSPEEKKPVTQGLRTGIELMVTQTGNLNGHIEAQDNKEQFITGKTAWFRQIWLSENQTLSPPFSGVLCRFEDGSGFYSVNMQEVDVLRGAITGACSADGLATPISQFIKVAKGDDAAWHIQVSTPKHHWILSDSWQQNTVIAGFVGQKEKLGFCMLSEDVLGDKTKG